MADMVIPAVFLEAELDKTSYTVTEGNTTTWKGFSVDVMNLLSEALGFTVLPFAVSDGGFYGLYGPSGNMLGVTGYLSRREAALSSMAMRCSNQRLDHGDQKRTRDLRVPSCAVTSKVQALRETATRPFRLSTVEKHSGVDLDQLIKLQQEDPTIQGLVGAKKTVRRMDKTAFKGIICLIYEGPRRMSALNRPSYQSHLADT
ncbi:hypothetical protein PoB_005544500 [Plakobranchus ocellatus]|uniref:Uncharacterized protein n=1 Tax=Plakobranchus ocellatus TaxID=259542 RepID=A0AAV4CBB1_9GAST|nr:hypothetical protein PoB_005544500 [Plakobranchus ocellatus]